MALDPHSDPLLQDLKPGPDGPVLGKCLLLEKLGQGGMGAVYRAHHLTFDIDVAVKMMVPVLGADPDLLRRRFLREARASAMLDHPSIVRVYDADQTGPYAFMVMEYVPGESLGQLVARRGPLDERAAVGLVAPACDAIAEAHRQGIVHRDLKPDNILLRASDGRVKVTDLGIAKFLETDDPRQLTRTLEAMGSPSFMSPEQVRSARDVDGRADVYSLAATVYNLVIGRPPFVGASVSEVVAAVLRDPVPDPCQLRPALSRAIGSVLLRALEKDPARRFATCDELRRALLEAAAERAEEARPRPKRVIELASTEAWRSRPPSPPSIRVEAFAGSWPDGVLGQVALIEDALALYGLGEDGGGPASLHAAAGALDALRRFVKQAARQDDIAWPFGVEEDLSLTGNVVRSALLAANEALAAPSARQRPRADLLVALIGDDGSTSLARCGRGAAFLVRGGRLALLTPGSDSIDAGLSGTPGLTPVVQEGALRPGDVVALCSRKLHAAVRRQLRGDVEGIGLLVTLMAAETGRLEAIGAALLGEAARAEPDDQFGVLLLRCAAREGQGGAPAGFG